MKRDPADAVVPGRRSTIAVLAPHVSTPLRNGADVYIWNKYGALDPAHWDARLVTADGVYALAAGGGWDAVRRVAPTHRSRAGALWSMLTRGLDYLSAKFATAGYLDLCRTVGVDGFDVVVCSYLSTWRIATALRIDPARLLLESHNFDQKVYLDRALELTGLKRLLAGIAAVQSHRLLRAIPPAIPLVALGPMDAHLFRAMGSQRVVQGRLGFDVRAPRVRYPASDAPRLLFVGSLSMTMNEMALREFVGGALPRLRDHLRARHGLALWFGVAGSQPSRALTDFLAAADVAVHPDPSDDALSTLVESCHATMLPFTSSNGLKLKFAYSASHGVPILSFLEPPEGLEDTPGLLVSADMAAWADRLALLQAEPGRSQRWAADLQDAARRNAWPAIVARELTQLGFDRATSHGPVVEVLSA